MAVDEATLRKWILAKIAGGEASRYNEIFGGGSFEGYEDHPRQHIPIGGGKYTSAAGLYQMIAPTWDDEKTRLGLKDFSPASQDAAAWDLANRTYQNATGRSLLDDAANSKIDWKALSGQWTSLKGKNNGQPESTSDSSDAGSPPLSHADADPMAGLRAYSQLQSLAPHLSFTPVDYDPFAVIGEKPNGQA